MNQDPVSVLVVDDNEFDALLTRRILSRTANTRFVMEWAATYADGLKKLTTVPFGVGLIDLHLDERDGIQLIRSATQAGCKMPLIVLTGAGDVNVEAEAIRAGAADYLVKGNFDAELLERVIRHAIERQRVQTALAEERQRLKTLIDNLPDLIYFKDQASRFVLCNLALLKLLGLDALEQAVGKTDHDFFPAELAAQYLADEQRILATGQALINKEETTLDTTGRIHWLLTSKVPLTGPAGTVVGLVGVGRDISTLKEVEDELRRARDELEVRVKERTAELSAAVTMLRDEVSRRQLIEGQLREAIVGLEKHNKEKSEFVTNVSHELKTPLTSMLFGTRNLLQGIAGPLPEKAIRYLKMYDIECQRLVSTINDILDLGRLDNRVLTLSMTTVPVARLLSRSVEALRPQMEQEQPALELVTDPTAAFVRCDAGMIQRVIHNLVSNAIKFTPPPGVIRLRAEPAPDSADAVLISVTDNGIGIPSHAMQHIAKRYFKAGRHASGSGLGLAISKEILSLHGGTLSVVSPPPGQERGTQVTIRLSAAVPPTLLVVGRSAEQRELARRALAPRGYGVEGMETPDQALHRLETGELGAILLDMRDDEQLGLDVLARLRQSAGLLHVPVLAMTATASTEATLTALQRFGAAVLPAPWNETELVEKIEEALLSKVRMPLPEQETAL